MTHKNIQEKLENKLPYLKEKYNVIKIGIFGSYVRGEQKKRSDIDIIVEFDSPIGFFQFIRLENYLSRLLGKKVDLVTKKAIKPILRKEIINEVEYV